MVWSRPFNDEEIEYIKAVFPQMGASAIARKLGRSRSGVNGKISELGLRARRTPCARDAREEAGEPQAARLAKSEDDAHQDTLAMLRELRHVQRTALMEAEPRNIPSISAEYRATLAEIDRIENDNGEKEGGDPLDALILNIGVRGA